MKTEEKAEKALDARARRAAARVGLKASRSRSQQSGNNQGGFMLVNPNTNVIECGERFNLSPEEVIEYCRVC